MKATDTTEFLGSLNAGVFAQQVGRALSDVAAGVVDHGKKGKVVLTFELSQIGESNQVKINHKLDFAQPTKRGTKREDTALDTPMYVTANGIELFQNDPTAQLFSKQDTPVIAREV
ncbi:MAG: hypothetical protein KJ989_15390 [Gammaproteobacteria bacterium]|uniref:Prophage PssSM-02 n=1 Tax=viral metagenome TaxID=1070528 RepID=A0A6M3XHD4_9ZZZZ|nr:hypothetical protein [Gammaproteobacteria bacterium]MBU2067501.1 hypothetical protein [Gammaproteobacteria bacterium]MBU2139511.1 hypothetical protein [Gammaproteobacteria bacterium]MBU2255939.1 hypothetical protein [Gammaproteobacteria bacterium]MBU2295584.1 hypothetical protein [Gammaproteobacteria bacterium]